MVLIECSDEDVNMVFIECSDEDNNMGLFKCSKKDINMVNHGGGTVGQNEGPASGRLGVRNPAAKDLSHKNSVKGLRR